MSRRKQSRLNVDKLYEAALEAEQVLPDMVKKLVARFDSMVDVRNQEGHVVGKAPISVKEQVMILRALQGTTLQKPRLEDAEGLMKGSVKITGNTFLSLGSGSLEQLEGLPLAEQEKYILDRLHNRSPVDVAALPYAGAGDEEDRGTGGPGPGTGSQDPVDGAGS